MTTTKQLDSGEDALGENGMNCKRCNSKIPAARLAAVPTATRCRPCQERYDLTPAERFGQRLDDVMAIGGERDGDHHKVGGDSYVR